MDKGFFNGKGQEFVSAYGMDFTFDSHELLKSDSSRRLIGEGSSNLEFVGTKSRLELQAYYSLREKLASHIKNKMKEEYEVFGGREVLRKWYMDKLQAVMDKIYMYCVKCHENYLNTSKRSFPIGKIKEVKVGEAIGMPTQICHSYVDYYDECKDWIHWQGVSINMSKYDKHEGWLCPITGKKPSLYFKFTFDNIREVENFIEVKTPQFCMKWKKDSHYVGNSILDVIDPVSELKSPISDDHFNFSFSIHLSRSGMNQLKKKNL